MKYIFSEQAVCKAVLHAAKYAHAPVCGIFIGKHDSEREDDVCITDAFPLSHSVTNSVLSPILESAFGMVESIADDDSKVIVGFYVAPESTRDEDTIPSVAQKIGTKISSVFPSAAIALIPSSAFRFGDDDSLLTVHAGAAKTGSWRALGAESVVLPSGAKTKLQASLDSGAEQRLVDFDEFLDDMSLDWTNAAVCDKV
eukprot:Rmarinus@m.17129